MKLFRLKLFIVNWYDWFGLGVLGAVCFLKSFMILSNTILPAFTAEPDDVNGAGADVVDNTDGADVDDAVDDIDDEVDDADGAEPDDVDDDGVDVDDADVDGADVGAVIEALKGIETTSSALLLPWCIITNSMSALMFLYVLREGWYICISETLYLFLFRNAWGTVPSDFKSYFIFSIDPVFVTTHELSL